MRKVTKEVCQAFLAGKKKASGNTTTDGQTLWLHGNVIAWKGERDLSKGVYLTLAGWPTVTTRERLNGLLELTGHPRAFHQKKGEQHYYTTPIDSNDKIFID